MAGGLDSVLSDSDHRERHELRVRATPAQALAAAREVPLAAMPLVRFLFRLRGLRVLPQGSFLDVMSREGFRELEPGLLVGVGQPWRLSGGLRAVDDFGAFAEPGYAKMAMEVRAESHSIGALVVTETRIQLTDPISRRRFGLYWLVVRPFSGLVRRSWLRAAKRRAEAES